MRINVNDLLLYGGGTLAALAVLAGVVFLCAILRKKKKLSATLNEEYGEKEK